MKYILNGNNALRSWWLIPGALIEKGSTAVKVLSEEDFRLMKACDGIRDMPETPRLRELLEEGLIREAGPEDRLTPWQEARECENRFFSGMSWMITGRQYYNRSYQYNGGPEYEWTWSEAESLMNEARDCGILYVDITGGEPMMHPRFMDILKGITDRGMYVREINTDGALITPEILREMRQAGCKPEIRITFEGAGVQDQTCHRKGAEKATLRAMESCLKAGLNVMAQININRRNLALVPDTLDRLDTLGVQTARLIRTYEREDMLSTEEYYDGALEAVSRYAAGERQMKVIIWSVLQIQPGQKRCILNQERTAYRDSLPVCSISRGKVFIGSDGELAPCHHMLDWQRRKGISLGNARHVHLQRLLQYGPFIDSVCRTLYELKQENRKCADCREFSRCRGGCRLAAALLTGDLNGCDTARCLFYGNDYPARIAAMLPGYSIE